MSEERLHLQNGIIYGPVHSRRLGESLGINISPQEIKMCSLNCAYCQYSWTGILVRDGLNFRKILPTVSEVESALKKSLVELKSNAKNLNFLTFSGNGEPTLHPDFPKIVDIVVSLREKFVPEARTAILSNSTTLDKKGVFSSLQKIDERIMKLDAGNEKMFRILNRPTAEIDFEEIVSNLATFKGDITIQTLFVEGEIDNTKDSELESYIKKLKVIKPKLVQIYSLDRPPAYKRIEKVSQSKLHQIKNMLARELNLNIVVY